MNMVMPRQRLWPLRAQSFPTGLGSQAGLALGVSQKRRIGTKYQAKLDQAQKEWLERAERIKAGTEPNLFDIFEERGYIKDTAGTKDYMREVMRQKRIGAYVGVDPTAPSLHIGHLLPFMPIFWMYMHGYRAVTLIGGSTAKIGDPTGRLKGRERMPASELTTNLTKIHYQLKGIWANVEVKARRYGYEYNWAWRRGIVNNNTWWNSMPMLEVMRRLGSSLRMGPMLSRDTVKNRLKNGDGMSFAEFAYPMMQGWDFWELFRQQGVQMQIGGSDQYGNIVAGVEAVKHCIANETDPNKKLPHGGLDDPIGFTTPLLVDSSGAKFGKSAGNAIWLDPFMTSLFDAYGYFVCRPDADVEQLLKYFTFMPTHDIKMLMDKHNQDPSKRLAQHKLGYEVLSLVHGDKLATETQEQHRSLFGVKPKQDNSAVARMAQFEPKEAITTIQNRPRIDMKLPESLIQQKSLSRILHAAGLASSVGEGHRICNAKGAYIGGSPGQKVATNQGMNIGSLMFTPAMVWSPEHNKRFLIDDKILILRKGKHNVRIIEIVSDEEWKKSGSKYPGEPASGNFRAKLAQLKALKQGIRPVSDPPGAPKIDFPNVYPKYRKVESKLRDMESRVDSNMESSLKDGMKAMEEQISKSAPN